MMSRTTNQKAAASRASALFQDYYPEFLVGHARLGFLGRLLTQYGCTVTQILCQRA